MTYLRLYIRGCWIVLREVPDVLLRTAWLCLLPVTWPYYVGRFSQDDDDVFPRIFDP